MTSIPIIEVVEVGEVDTSRALVGKYHIVDQVQEISCGGLNIGL